MPANPAIDFTSRATQVCPFAAYAAIRDEGGVYIDAQTGFYIVTDYSTVKSLTGDNRRLSNQVGLIGTRQDPRQSELDRIFEKGGLPIRDVLVSSDPPLHTSQRALVDKVFSPVRVLQIEAYIRQVVEGYFQRFLAEGLVDFHAAVSVMVPMTVIADQLGLPRSEEDIARFKKWSDAVAYRSEPGVSHEAQIGFAHEICDLQRFIIARVNDYRAIPGDCILSDLVQANVAGERLALDELVSIAMILIVAGNETTTSAISNAMVRLVEQPDLQSRLRAEPGLIENFVEEILRLDAPLQGLFRRALVDLDINGTHVPAGSVLVLKWGAANRDPAKFADPDALDLDRANSRQHLTFGFGPHFCVGNQLARSEVRRTFEYVLRHMKNIRLADRPEPLERQPHYVTFGVKKLWIEFDRA